MLSLSTINSDVSDSCYNIHMIRIFTNSEITNKLDLLNKKISGVLSTLKRYYCLATVRYEVDFQRKVKL